MSPSLRHTTVLSCFYSPSLLHLPLPELCPRSDHCPRRCPYTSALHRLHPHGVIPSTHVFRRCGPDLPFQAGFPPDSRGELLFFIGMSNRHHRLHVFPKCGLPVQASDVPVPSESSSSPRIGSDRSPASPSFLMSLGVSVPPGCHQH